MVVIGAGDEIRVQFSLPESDPPPGWTRDFILHCVGWDKDADLNTLSGQSTEPLPSARRIARISDAGCRLLPDMQGFRLAPDGSPPGRTAPFGRNSWNGTSGKAARCHLIGCTSAARIVGLSRWGNTGSRWRSGRRCRRGRMGQESERDRRIHGDHRNRATEEEEEEEEEEETHG